MTDVDGILELAENFPKGRLDVSPALIIAAHITLKDYKARGGEDSRILRLFELLDKWI